MRGLFFLTEGDQDEEAQGQEAAEEVLKVHHVG